MQPILLLLGMAVITRTTAGTSCYPIRLEDPKAVYLATPQFQVQGDGSGDDTSAIQGAVDTVQEARRQGIVFVPSGTYRITRTINVWPGVRLIGYGPTRPTFLLAENTPGFQGAERFMVSFAGRRSAAPSDPGSQMAPPGRNGLDFDMPNEANPGTFYSALSNIDIEIRGGNPAAVGIRGRYAQHCYLAHIDFRLGSALAGIHDTGNEADDLHFHGGQYGIITRTPSPGWQFTLLDSSFDGQSKAAIRTHETGLTLIRPSFTNLPTAVAIEPGHTEQLWIKDAMMENLTGPATQISRESSLRLQINAENVACRHVPVFASFLESGRLLTAPANTYVVNRLCHGLQYDDLGATGAVKTTFDCRKPASLLPIAPTDVPPLPSPSTWVNLASLGAKGDGSTDDTSALRRAISKFRTIYLPTGKYRVTDTIRLKSDTVLIGLNPITTQIVLTDGTPGFGVENSSTTTTPSRFRRGGNPFPGNPKALLEAPQGGSNIVTGIGLDTGGNNPAATAAKWMAGKDSMMDDVKFIGGHGSGGPPIYNNDNSADPNPLRRWDSQYPSLWVTEGGGGTFKNIWTASTFAQAGMRISNTSTSGRVYQMSSEHHVRNEVQIRNASNWSLYALQTEEERGESAFALPLEIENSSNITLANLNMYRVVSMFQPFPYGIKVSASKDIRFLGVHCYSNSKVSFDNLLFDQTHGAQFRQREFAQLTLSGNAPQRRGGLRVEKLVGGFSNISGGAVDRFGNFYFVDARWHRIYRWSVSSHQLDLVQDSTLFPTNLVFDKAGNLIVISSAGKGTVYTFKPGDDGVTLLHPQAAIPRPVLTPVLPVTDWQLAKNIVAGRPLIRPWQYVSPDGTTFIPTGQDFVDGALTYGIKLEDDIRSFGLAKAVPGKPFYVMGESELRTYSVVVGPDGSMSRGKLFAEQGGEGWAADSHGNVYIAAGDIFVYSPAGKLIETIQVPERPIQLMFGGVDGSTLFIAARSSLYSMRTRL